MALGSEDPAFHSLTSITSANLRHWKRDVKRMTCTQTLQKLSTKLIMMRKLSELGIGVNLLRWIRIFLRGRKQGVVVEGISSVISNVISVVPKGTVLGPKTVPHPNWNYRW